MSFEILRYQDGYTDKAWVIEHGQSEIQVWHGSTLWSAADGHSAQLVSKTVSGTTSSYDRAHQKRRKGYQPWPGVTFDKQSQRIVADTASVKDLPEATPAFWYRIDKREGTLKSLAEFLTELRSGMDVLDADPSVHVTRAEFEALSITEQLERSDLSGSSEYTESPLAAFVLFALRRRFHGTYVSDDDNQPMSESFRELYNWLLAENQKGTVPFVYTPNAARTIAIALSVIDAPEVDWANIATSRRRVAF